MNFLKALAVALLVATCAGSPAFAEAPACMTPDKAQAEIAGANGGIKPAAVLDGEKAQAFAQIAGRSGDKLVYLIYVQQGHVFIFEFEAGCFRTQGAMPLEVFRLMYPGILPEGV